MMHYADDLKRAMRRLPARSLLDEAGAEALSYRDELRARLAHEVLGIPPRREVRSHFVSQTEQPHYRRQSYLIECESGSWQTAQLYLPSECGVRPGILLASGHGGSKAHGYNQIAAQLYARMGCVVLVADPIGEEERHEPYGLGARGHRHHYIVDRMNEAGRPYLGKVVSDLRAGLDFLRQHNEVDAARIGAAGSSLGGTLVQLLSAIEPGIAAAIISSWAANYDCLDGKIGCCYRLPGLLRVGHQLDLMAMAAPECALMICSGLDDEITPPHGLQAMGERLGSWWAQWDAAARFDCRLEAGGGHRPYHLTPEGLQWMATHLQPAYAESLLTQPTRTLGELYAATGRKLEPLYDQPRHHQGTRLPGWPITLEPPDALRIATPEVLSRFGLRPESLTLEGYLMAQQIPLLETVAPPRPGLTQTPEAAAKRVAGALQLLAPQPEWWHTEPGHWTEEGDGSWSIDLGLIGARLHVSRPVQAGDQGTLFLRRTPDLPDGFSATLDLVAFNDDETLLNCPSLFTNLYLAQRAVALLQARYGGSVSWHLVSAVPRLGELLFLRAPALRSLTITAAQAVERASAGTGRAENIVPGSAGTLNGPDLLLAAVPRPVSLPQSYLHPESLALLRSYPSFHFC